MAKTGSVAIQLAEVVDQYDVKLKRATNNAMDVVAKEAVRRLKSTSPKKSGEYARGWGLTRERGTGGINTVTVKNRVYQLTHLLENGHIVRNKKGTYGRAPGIKHIAPVEDWANTELPEEIEREMT